MHPRNAFGAPKLFLYQDGKDFYHVLTDNLYMVYPRHVRDGNIDQAKAARSWVTDRAKEQGYDVEFGEPSDG